MPTYDYACSACNHEFEAFHSITAKPLRKCPECGKLKLKKLIGTGAGVIFKGSGFYETDYRSDSYKKAAKADSGEKSSEKSAEPAKAESSSATSSTADKPASKTADTKPAAKKSPSKSKD